MNRSALRPALPLLLLILHAIGLVAAEAIPADTDRSPIDLVLSSDGAWLVTANQTSSSVSLVRISDGKVLDELRVGDKPAALALAPDRQHVLVTSTNSGIVSMILVAGEKLQLVKSIPTGGLPHGIAVTSDGDSAYVALSGTDEIAVLDLRAGTVAGRFSVGRWPKYLSLSPDGMRLAVGTSGDRGVSIVDPLKGELLHVDRFVGLNIGHLQASRDGQHVYFPWMVYRRNSITPGNIRLGWVLATRMARVRLDGKGRREAISLDPPGKAVADPFGIALSSDESQLVISAAGTHELLVMKTDGLPYKDQGGTDHIDAALLADSDRFFRIELGGRPMAVRFGPDDQTVYVANYLENAVQVVDLKDRQIVRSIALGGNPTPSLARQGESIFLDARRSLDQWYSCYSCHQDGGSNAVAMDTDNDGTAFTFKSVLPLYNVSETGPWTWHGWQQDLHAAMHKSLTSTMLGPQPTADDVRAMVAYLDTLQPPPNPHRNGDEAKQASIERGKKIFESDAAACVSCHSGPYFTDGQIHDVGLGKPNDRYKGFNTPSLVGVWQKVTLLHDAQCSTLEEVLTGPHEPSKVAGSRSLTEEELRDLVAYLKTL